MSNATSTITGLDVNRNVSRVVRILMALNSMEQRDLARSMDCDPAVVSRLFKGERVWTVQHLVRLSEVFDRPMSDFFEPADSLIRSTRPQPSGPNNEGAPGDVTLRSLRGIGTDNTRWLVDVAA